MGAKSRLNNQQWAEKVTGKKRGGKAPQGQAAQPDNSDIDAIFKGIQQIRGPIRRGWSGQILDNNAPGGLDAFYAQNPHVATPEMRQATYQQEAQNRYNTINRQGQEAVNFLKEQQSMPKPTSFSSQYGTGSVDFGGSKGGMMPHPISGKMVSMRQYLPKQSKVQDTKFGPMAGQENGGALTRPRASGISEIFPTSQPSKQVSPSGGVMDSLVGLPLPKGAPGGEFAPMPDWVGQAGKKPVGTANAPQRQAAVNPTKLPKRFENQLRSHYTPQPSKASTAPNSNPFVGAPLGRDLTPNEQEMINFFMQPKTYWDKKDTNTAPKQRPIYAKPESRQRGPLDALISYPFLSNESVAEFGSLFPSYDWSLNQTPIANMERLQQNINQLIEQGLLDYQLSGQPRTAAVDSPSAPGAARLFKPRVVPQYPEEQLMQSLFGK